MEAIEPAYGTGPLLLIAGAAIAFLLLLVVKVRLHPFVSLVLTSLLVALATQIPLADIVPTLMQGFGETLASVGLLVGLGVMIGRMLEVTGGAAVLAHALIAAFGPRLAPLALGIASLLFGFPIFFDAGLIVMLPIIFSVARRLGGSVLLYALPAAGAFATMHAFVPPHPGPVAAADQIGADMGMTLVVGLVLAIPTWFIASYLYSFYAGRRIELPVPEDFTSEGELAYERPPHLFTVIGILLLPMLLIFGNTGTATLVTTGTLDEGSLWVLGLTLVGETPIALLITAIVAVFVLGLRRFSRERVERICNDALGPVCAIILITGAGGMFGGVLRVSGVGTALESTLAATGLPVIVAAFVIALALRVAQGSATVALTTAAALIAPAVEGASGLSSVDMALIVIAIACGATALSHVNDSGFWLVGRFLGMDVPTTLRTWTVMVTLIGFTGFVLACVGSLLF
ncbi:GntP family gluconate:H+ symporter [Lipingzhangella halophila]|uniref:GntP family gluconate:H+ symporter n=1 Tax=Lipingzhangella halophila TaxID=1783352 RepID=A0A7W7W3N9_9ACTN|nr:GntP family permease [Lipingzhangella halophila]MBB4932713.1 GntP family gluconate:H+ symporter [Lipingzhangella halophila]